jgi:hypothetical protein
MALLLVVVTCRCPQVPRPLQTVVLFLSRVVVARLAWVGLYLFTLLMATCLVMFLSQLALLTRVRLARLMCPRALHLLARVARCVLP